MSSPYFRLLGSLALGCFAYGDPPGALIPVKVEVPASLHSGTFASDRTLFVPPGFRISLMAIVPGARFLAVAPNGDLFVSQPGPGLISVVRAGASAQVTTFASGLTRPHDMVFHSVNGQWSLFVSESTQIDRYSYTPGDTAAHGRTVVVSGLPDSSTPELRGAYAHELKNIAIGADEKLYVSIGSSCNVCTSDTVSDPVRGAIYQYSLDGSGKRLFARGLRNAEGLAFVPGSNSLWAVVNNRDNLPYPSQDSTGNYGRVLQSFVDNHPPELFTAIRDGGNYGWPFCNPTPDSASGYDNMPFERDFDTNADGHVDCGSMDRISKGIQAHSAPLGMSFLNASRFPAQYRMGAVAALHGSWNRTALTGYKVAYFPWSADTQKPGAQIDLVAGWLDSPSNAAWGRPVDAIPDQQGHLLISDDATSAIYQLRYAPAAIHAASGYASLAPGGIASAFGSGFTTQTEVAQTLPLGTTLGGGSLLVRDSAGVERSALLYAVTPTQINFVVPEGSATGLATIRVGGRVGIAELGTAYITNPAPGLFTANANGEGVAAATAVRVDGTTNKQTPVEVFACDASGCMPSAIDVSGGAAYLSLYGSGIGKDASRVSVKIGGVSAPVLFAGPQGGYPGLDQINVAVPASLAGAGDVAVTVQVDAQTSNEATLRIR